MVDITITRSKAYLEKKIEAEKAARKRMQARPPRKWECALCGFKDTDKSQICKPVPLA